jgi:glycosyltransferase involved in cell wall biosynthesis
MNDSKPKKCEIKVSVVIPCYNSAPYLPEAVESVLNQTLKEIEIIVVNDGSVDNTREVAEAIIEENINYHIRLINQDDSGLASARNRGIAEAQGQYIIPLDADDLIAPTMLEECSSILDEETDISLVYTDRQDFGEIEKIWRAGKYDLSHLKYFNQIYYCALFRKQIWEEIGGYRTNISGCDDWDFWIAAAARGYQGYHITKPLLKYRRRKKSFMAEVLKNYENYYARIILNNREVYSPDEIEAAERLLSKGEVASLFKSAKFLYQAYFLGKDSQTRE